MTEIINIQCDFKSFYVLMSGANERPSEAVGGTDVLRPTESKQDCKTIFQLAGYAQEDFSVCLGCKICASVCTVNDLSLNVNPQDILISLFMGEEVSADHGLVRYCTNCYRCTHACPWGIRIPEVIRAVRESLAMESTFEKAFKGSLKIWGRVYEPYIFLRAGMFLVKEGYLRYMPKWTEYMSFHLPHKVKRIP